MKIANQGKNEDLIPRERYTSTSQRARPLLYYNWPARPASAKIAPPTELLTFASEIFRLASENSRHSLSAQSSACDPRFVCPSQYGKPNTNTTNSLC